MFCFGPTYDQNPQLPWASPILNSPLLARSDSRIDSVFDAALEHLRQNPNCNFQGRDNWIFCS
jgi:hypothetical protein